MVSRRLLLGATLLCLLVGALGAFLYLRQRVARCAPTPFLADELLPNAPVVAPGELPRLPAGWTARAPGAELRGPAVDGQGFDLDGDGRALQLIGIGNYVMTPAAPVRPGQRYCFSGFALTDSAQRSPTRARLVFQWRTTDGATVREAATTWQPVTLWTPEAPPRDWAPLRGSFVAPDGAAALTVRVEPASDDRLYLDLLGLRAGGDDLARLAAPPERAAVALPRVAPWPLGRAAAVAFTFDWETAMGGLVHSRSVGDPNVDQDYLARAVRMREGITTTLAIFAPLNLRATYYATGYNFLAGNRERRRFLADPTFGWASQANGWTSDRWTRTPWFADDPYGSIASNPGWYFEDQIAPLRAAGQAIQSHTFSHLYGGLTDPATWQRDLQTWNEVAAAAGVPHASSLAFPWSGSAGMSDAAWDALEQAGITSVTRLSDQAQYSLWASDAAGLKAAPRCRWLPGREGRIVACPDFYLTPARADLALRQVELAVTAGGMIDLWAHTEEVTTPEQIAAWQRVAGSIAKDTRLWVAPLSEIADWQTAVAEVSIEQVEVRSAEGVEVQTLTLTNSAQRNMAGLSLKLPATTQRVLVSGDELARKTGQPDSPGWWPAAGLATFDLAAGQTVEVQLWLTP